jgi:hypothetical protein
MTIWQRWRSRFRRTVTTEDVEVEWQEWADRLSHSSFILYLAGQVAADLLARKGRATLENLLDAVVDDTACMSQHQAEAFLTRRLGVHVLDANMLRVVLVFRRAVQHKLRQAFSD